MTISTFRIPHSPSLGSLRPLFGAGLPPVVLASRRAVPVADTSRVLVAVTCPVDGSAGDCPDRVTATAIVIARSQSTRSLVEAHMGKGKEVHVPAACRIVRLEELVEEHQHKEVKEIEEITAAIADGEVTPGEHGRIVSILSMWQERTKDVSRELNVVADGAEMVRTLASTFAITPKVDRKLREKRADYLRLVVVNDDPMTPEAA